MKLIIVTDYNLPSDGYKPMCGTCKYRGNVSITYDVANGIPIMLKGKLKNVTITGVHCNHPSTPNKLVQYEYICDNFCPVNDLLKRIFLTKRLI